MGKSKKANEPIPGIIPENERRPELELKVQEYLLKVEPPTFISKKRYTPTIHPTKFADNREKIEYYVEEFRRMREGYDGLSGKGYGWLHHAHMRDPERGKIRPTFQVRQEEYFQKVESLRGTGSGIVGFKRRRWGFSWAGAWDDLHDCMTHAGFMVGMNSKSESDSRNLFRNVKFHYQNLHALLRPRSTASDRRDFMHFAWFDKDEAGNKITKGLDSWISSVAPSDSAHEGQAYSKLRIDEAGKISNLMTIWGYAEDCLRLGVRRVGLPVIMGTVGDIDKDGKGLMEMYLNNEAYDLERFCVYGYHGMFWDEFGNDLVEDAIRWIVYQKAKLEGASKRAMEVFRQKYPLGEDDAFLTVNGSGVGNPQIISQQKINLYNNPPEARVGKMKLVGELPHFEPNAEASDSHVIIYELPKPLVNGYRAVLDPAEDDGVKKTRDSSDLGFTIAARPYGLLPMRLAAEYCHRPMKLEDAYYQFALLCKFYNCKITIEMNKGGWRAFKWFEQNFPELLELAPKAATSAKGGVELKYGVKMTPERKNQMEGLLNDDIDHNCLPNPVTGHKGMPSVKMLDQYKVFGADHKDDDLAVSWGWQCILEQADKRAVKSAMDAEKKEFNHRMERQDGRPVVVRNKDSNKGPYRRFSVPKSPFSR